MTNQEAKHKAIQEAYGEYWEANKENIDDNGWFNCGYCINGLHDVIYILSIYLPDFNVNSGYYQCTDDYGEGWMSWIPKSLSGIEDNNGWVRIEPDGSNLPTKSGMYLWLRPNGEREEFEYHIESECDKEVFECRFSYLISGKITHYRPVEEIPNPIY